VINFCFLVSALLAVVATPHGRGPAEVPSKIEPTPTDSTTNAATSGEVSP